MRVSRLIMGVFLLGGIALLGWMVGQVGVTDLLASFQAVGFWLLPFCAPGVRPCSAPYCRLDGLFSEVSTRSATLALVYHTTRRDCDQSDHAHRHTRWRSGESLIVGAYSPKSPGDGRSGH